MKDKILWQPQAAHKYINDFYISWNYVALNIRGKTTTDIKSSIGTSNIADNFNVYVRCYISRGSGNNFEEKPGTITEKKGSKGTNSMPFWRSA